MRKFFFIPLFFMVSCEEPIFWGGIEEIAIIPSIVHKGEEFSIWVYTRNKNPKEQWEFEIELDGQVKSESKGKKIGGNPTFKTKWTLHNPGAYTVTACIYSGSNSRCESKTFSVRY